MKHLPSWRRAAVLALAALAACDGGPTESTRPDDPGQQAARALGLDPRTVQDFGSYWLAEGDIVIPKAAASPGAAGPRSQFMTLNAVWTNPGNIVVDLSRIAGNPEWQDAVRTAIAAWSAVPGTTIRMVEGTPGNITVTTECRFDGVLGRSGFPTSDGRPYSSVVFNTCWVDNGFLTTPTPGARTHTAAHELGHTIGFRHTNMFLINEGNGPEGVPLHIDGTPAEAGDANSVMNGQSAGTEWAGLSFFDRFAVVSRYPVNPVVSVDYSSGNPVVSWNAIAGATDYTVELLWQNQVRNQDWETSENTSVVPVGTTTGTSVVDTNFAYTGQFTCSRMMGDEFYTATTWYRVTANFPAGTTVTKVLAEVASC
ncbi:MAG TPA: M57 family metalloprotease [Longimicrobiaceae bacterium]